MNIYRDFRQEELADKLAEKISSYNGRAIKIQKSQKYDENQRIINERLCS